MTVGLALVGQMAFADTSVTMSGDITEGGGAATGAAISSGANASTPGVSGEIQLDFEMPDVIAMAIFQGGDVTTTQGAPLLAGRYSAPLDSDLSLTNVTDILNDIVKTGNEVDKTTGNTDILKIGGVVYSSTGSAILTVEPVDQGGTTDLPANSISVLFTNQDGDGSILVGFEGSFTDGTTPTAFTGADETSITTGPVAMSNTDNRGTFLLYGDVLESSVTSADDVGTYEGTLTITTVIN